MVYVTLVCNSGNTDRSQCVELTDRELSVFEEICHSAKPVSFSQLKSSTQLHQEVLSRVLRRLMTHGVVKKVDGGKYRMALT